MTKTKRIQAHREMLQDLLIYYNGTRRAGHTYTMLKGAENTDCRIVVASHEHARLFKLLNSKSTLPLNNMEVWRGLRVPLAWDNYTITTLIADSLFAINELSKKVER